MKPIMTEKVTKNFCMECRKETEYFLREKEIKKDIKNKEYTFKITVAVCAECGEEKGVPGLLNQNVREISEQYIAAGGLI